MARIRSVHPSLFTDEAWVSCSPLARILYIGLWTDADDQGLFEWKPLQIKMRLLPGDGADASALLEELVGVDLIASYEVDGKRYGAIRAFRKFQRPQKPNAIHPLSDEIAAYVGLSANDTGSEDDHSATGSGKDKPMEDGGGKEEEKNPPTPRRGRRKPETALPVGCPSAEIVEAMQSEARADGRNIDIGHEARQFRDWWTAKDGRHRDWDAAWRTWARRAIAKAPRTATSALATRRPVAEADRWRTLIREFRANGYWPSDDAGPAPGRPGCRAPPEVLAEFGQAPRPANDAPLFAQPGEAA